jgi:hypothetical protein
MDHSLSNGDSTNLCARLKERGIPYISYSGYAAVSGADPTAPRMSEACPHAHTLTALEELLPSTPRMS